MSVLGVGVDSVQLERIQHVFEKHGERFVSRLLSPCEKKTFLLLKRKSHLVNFLAKSFAAKEAASKVLGTGIGHMGVCWVDFSLQKDTLGAPNLKLKGCAHLRAKALGIQKIHLSLTGESGMVLAFCVGSSS